MSTSCQTRGGTARAMAFLVGLTGMPGILLGTEATEPKPNVVLFLSDDHGYSYSGCYGNQVVRSPNLDRLAAEGMRFTGAFAGSPTCSPSRSVIFTGLMPMRNGAHPNHSAVYPDTKSLPHYLGRLGYRVVLAGKVHVKPRRTFPFEYLKATLPADPSFRRKYRSEGLDAEAIDQLLADHAADRSQRPLCLIIASSCPHVTWRPNRSYEPAKVKILPYIVDTPSTRNSIARYYTDITLMDQRLGACLQSVDKHGLRDNTLLIYTSDQGGEWPHGKWNLYDAGIRVPMIVRWPGKVKAGTVNDAMVGLVDLLPTFIEAAGGTPPADLDGRSLLPVILGETSQHRRAIFATHTGDGKMNDSPMRCIRTRTHKYILNLKPQNTYTTHITEDTEADGRDYWPSWLAKAKTDKRAAHLVRNYQHRPAEELYDLRTDPDELGNIAADPANRDLLASLRRRLKDWMEEQGDRGVEAEPENRTD